MNLYKYLSYALIVCCLFLGVVYLYKDYQYKNRFLELNNMIVEKEGMLKESETMNSKLAFLIEDLSTENKDLQKKLKVRDEAIAVAGEVALKWKKQYLKIKNAQSSVVEPDGKTPSDVSLTCRECLLKERIRVDFETVQNFLKVSGYTITNPDYAELEIEWTRGLKFDFYITKKDDVYRIYFDTNSPDVVVADLNLKLDPSVFKRNWYENIGVSANMGLLGDGVSGTFALVYDLGRFIVGPSVSIYADDDDDVVGKTFGGTLTWFPVRRN
jgi:hypothetical protein